MSVLPCKYSDMGVSQRVLRSGSRVASGVGMEREVERDNKEGRDRSFREENHRSV